MAKVVARRGGAGRRLQPPGMDDAAGHEGIERIERAAPNHAAITFVRRDRLATSRAHRPCR